MGIQAGYSSDCISHCCKRHFSAEPMTGYQGFLHSRSINKAQMMFLFFSTAIVSTAASLAIAAAPETATIIVVIAYLSCCHRCCAYEHCRYCYHFCRYHCAPLPLLLNLYVVMLLQARIYERYTVIDLLFLFLLFEGFTLYRCLSILSQESAYAGAGSGTPPGGGF